MAKEKGSFFETRLMRTKIRSSTVTLFPEAALGYLLGPLLALICNGVINVWLVQYWDKVLGLGQWAPVFQTVLPIVSAIVIVVGNILVGKLMERKPTLAGKARPLILLGMPIIAVSLLVLFLVPFPGHGNDFEPNVFSLISVAVGYNLFYALAWPIYYTSHSALINLSTRDGDKRGLLATCIMAAQLGAAGLSGMFGGILVDVLGLMPTDTITAEEANQKWVILMVVMIVALVIGCLLEYFFTRERITEEQVNIEANTSNAKKEVKKVSMKEQINICVHDKYWWIIVVFFFLYQFGGMMKNNDMSFYSYEMTGAYTLSSLINTIGAIPTAAGMAIVWPIAAKIGKTKTITLGGFLALIGGAMAFICLIPGLNDQIILNILGTDLTTAGLLSVVAFIVKALGTCPAMYISLAVMALVLDHQEAVHGVRTDGFTMAVYGSIMVAMSGIANGVIVGINAILPQDAGVRQFVHTFLAFGVEAICYLVMAVMFMFLKVEKYTKVDRQVIVHDQKVKVLAEGGLWIEPEERARLEDEENDRLVVEGVLAQMKLDCERKHKDYDAESKAFLAKHDEQLAAKKAKADEAKAKADAAEAALPKEVKAKRAAKEAEALKEINDIRKEFGRDVVVL